ncbi:hypothetical protein F5B19DRAFT_479057 [Rostrohypoxylon terebratum]|nr:hypothetical protein F5B19DRAFT_479057 [Rostrohypoxylon terebratum]
MSMGRPPAYIFIVRHGNRLDATDKQWHLSSPTPYDPPLTYGGWMQSKTVGARIASILQERENYDEAASIDQPSIAPVKQKKRRYKVVIHSSPFLRCTQTSIAIAAGLASSSSVPATIERSLSPHTPASPPSSAEKCVLRLDPFLGEWLSPDYFEHITPPPKSSLMLMTAKAELLRRENYNDYPHFHNRHTPNAPTQLWNASPSRGSSSGVSVTLKSDVSSSALENLSTLKGSLPKLAGDPAGKSDPKAIHKAALDSSWIPGYVAPIPSYALSTNEPIPRGYVAHARDACVNVDYQWDSSREDFGWGEGGVLPEDWAAMHQRFRKGLCRLVEWYSTTENPGEMVTKTVTSVKSINPPQEECSSTGLVAADGEVEVEDVVVLVSHGAGCNALIGAITHQPVLIDVAMSSITLAQRKSEFHEGVNMRIYNGHASSIEDPLSAKRPTMSEMFELKLFANTEHLHSSLSPPAISRSSSTGGRNSHGRFSNGFNSSSPLQDINLAASLYGSPTLGSRGTSVNASLGSMRRGSPVLGSTIRPSQPNGTMGGGITVGSGVSKFPSTRSNRSGSVGLWTPPTHEDEVLGLKTEAPPLANSKEESEIKGKVEESPKMKAHGSISNNVESRESTDKVTSKSDSQSEYGEEHDKFDENAFPSLWPGTNTGGLWGVPRPPGEAEKIRDFSSTKRRWTVNDR